MQLTDSEQKRLLTELYNTTQTKIEAVLKRYKLDQIPAEIEALRKEQKARHKGGVSLWVLVKKVITFASSEANKIRIDE